MMLRHQLFNFVPEIHGGPYEHMERMRPLRGITDRNRNQQNQRSENG